jgi:hypothetical protein
MPIDPNRLKKINELMERADREQFDTQDYEMAKSLGQWYEQYMAELKKPNPSHVRLEQIMSDFEAKLDLYDARNDTSDRPPGAGAH